MACMRPITCTALIIVAALALPCMAMAAQVFRTYVASNGNDSNPCSLPAPCRLLPAALAQTQDGGEVWMLDSANYNTGTVTISHSVTILAIPGALGSLVANNADAVSIPVAGISATLRNLSVRNLAGNNYSGVYSTGSNGRLVVEDCEFSGMAHGIFIAAASAQVNVSRSTFLGNQTGLQVVGTSAAPAQASVDHSNIIGAGLPAAGRGVYGYYSNVVITDSTLANNGSGLVADTASTFVLGNNVIAQNYLAAYLFNSGVVQTIGNNTLFNNVAETNAGSLAPVTNQ